jgi:hypothetical protein
MAGDADLCAIPSEVTDEAISQGVQPVLGSDF